MHPFLCQTYMRYTLIITLINSQFKIHVYFLHYNDYINEQSTCMVLYCMKRNNLTSSVLVDIVIDRLVEIIMKYFRYCCPIFSCI